MKHTTKKTIFTTAVSVGLTMIAAPLTVLAEANGDVDTTNITSGIDKLGELLRKFGPNIFFVLLVLVGVSMMFGEGGRRWGKTAILFGVIGFLVVTFAPAIIGAFQGYFPSAN